ncbi:hypothetical protein [Streptomyces sp. NPDC018693]|uniref:hypothetical protein n=1 Tax=unclassified Streptomyces TaxID=2593676 RepID=UPI00378C7C49
MTVAVGHGKKAARHIDASLRGTSYDPGAQHTQADCERLHGVCSDDAITELGPGQGFAIGLDHCKGCGLCVAGCPCVAIEMVAED